MSLLKATGIISDHIGTAPVAAVGMGGLTLGSFGPGTMNLPINPVNMSVPMGRGISMGMGPLGFGAIRPTGSLGSLTPVSFSSKTNSVLHPAGMPIATTLNPFNPFDPNSTIVSNPFGGLSGLTGLNSNLFGFGAAGLLGTIMEKTYNKNGVDIIIRGCNSDIDAVIKCLDDHLTISKAQTDVSKTTTPTPSIAVTGAAPIAAVGAAAPTGAAVFPPPPPPPPMPSGPKLPVAPIAKAPVAPVAPVALGLNALAAFVPGAAGEMAAKRAGLSVTDRMKQEKERRDAEAAAAAAAAPVVKAADTL